MGLPLFTAPVESDVVSKPSDKSSSAYARSAIRRSRRPNDDPAGSLRRRPALEATFGGPDWLSPQRLDRSVMVPSAEGRPAWHARWSGHDHYRSSYRRRGRFHDSATSPWLEPSPPMPPSPPTPVFYQPTPQDLQAVRATSERSRAATAEAAAHASASAPAPVPGATPAIGHGDGEDPAIAAILHVDPADLTPFNDHGLFFAQPWLLSGNRRRPGQDLWEGRSQVPYQAPPPPPPPLQPPRRRTVHANPYSRFMRSPPARPSAGPSRSIPGGSNPRSVRFGGEGSYRQEGMDGLGDRDRSLSPEGDAVWDTLLTTLTPDPQPPSVGSSFASASGSNAASQSQTASTSARTSFTGPETIDEPIDDRPCESGCEDDPESSDGDEEDTLVVPPLPPPRRGYLIGQHPHIYANSGMPASRRSEGWALRMTPLSDERSRRPGPGESTLDGPVDGPVDGPTVPDTAGAATTDAGNNTTSANISSASPIPNEEDRLGGWQRIVRNLAARQDIPDEWWAEAGLSRTLSQGPSA